MMPMRIHALPETLINQIAAGEVIERPASVIKELVENALDAGATQIEIATAGGGKALLRVVDNGSGMGADDLALAVQRHCTSKITDRLDDIRSLGFRGEALPSIGSVSRLSIRTRQADDAHASEITVNGGQVGPVRPAAANRGTTVEVRDLFFATPARLKFLKGERAEGSAITETVRRIAIAFPSVRFVLSGPDRQTVDMGAARDHRERLSQVLGREFADNTIALDAEREDVQLTGFAGLPTWNRANSLAQFAYVNGRPVQDKMILSALRAAYSDSLPRGRYPVAALFFTLDPALVDVNVHPAKADVRFRDPGLVRGLIIGAIREALGREGVRASPAASADLASAFRFDRPGAPTGYRGTASGPFPSTGWTPDGSPSRPLNLSRSDVSRLGEPRGFSETQAVFSGVQPSARAETMTEVLDGSVDHPLGAARAQVHENYIIAQTGDGLVIVDQHAAHERLVFERLKRALHEGRAPSQILLLPEVVDLSEDDCDRLAVHADDLTKFGLVLERFGPGAVMVRETPALLGETDVQALVRDLADEIAEWDRPSALQEKMEAVASRMACHGSVRSGRRMRVEEMDSLLREMERTPGSGQCNHGRPTFIELKLSDIERLFARR